MLRNNPLLAQLKEEIRAATPRVEGVIKATEKNFGFLETDNGKSYFVPPPAMKKVLHGDRVEAVVHEEGDKTSVEPETLREKGVDRFVGRVRKKDGRLGVVPDHPLIRQTLNARFKRSLEDNPPGDGDWVMARLLRHPLNEGDRGFFVQIESLVVAQDDPRVPWRVTLARHELEQQCPAHDATREPADDLPREDLTGEPFFTIDSETTEDMDDALRVRALADGGWELQVAIADPTAYIDAEHAADQEARTRAFTVYLPGQNITMLPEAIAHHQCSLLAGEDRLALLCRLTVGADGALGDYRFFAGKIRSSAKLSYNQVSDWLEDEGDWRPEAALGEQLRALADLTAARIQWRDRHGVASQDRPDYVFRLDDSGAVLGIDVEERRIANRMIEEAMIAANSCCADFLDKQVGRGIFNTHRAFDPQKVEGARALLADHDIEVAEEALTELEPYCELRRSLDARGDAWLDARLRQFQGYSEFSPRPAPHFGMGVPAYATWTSPIRKYGDMVNHRLIKSALAGEVAADELSDQLIEQLSERRRLNRLAERDVKDWLYVR